MKRASTFLFLASVLLTYTAQAQEPPVKKHKPAGPPGVSRAGSTVESTVKAQPGYVLEPSGETGVVARMAGGGGLADKLDCQCSSTGQCKSKIDPGGGSATCSKPDIADACKGDCTFKRVPSMTSPGALMH